MSLFGSVLSDHFTTSSDIDVLIEFDPKHIPGLFSFVEMRDLLSEHFGREVDLRTPEDISKLFRNEVIQQSYLIYGKKDLNRLRHMLDAANTILEDTKNKKQLDLEKNREIYLAAKSFSPKM